MVRVTPKWQSLVALLFAQSAIMAAKVLTPERLLQAPRTSFSAVSPNSQTALIGAVTHDLEKHTKHNVLYTLQLPSADDGGKHGGDRMPKLNELVYNTTSGFYLGDDDAAFVVDDILYAKNVSLGQLDPLDPGFRIGAFPAPVSNFRVVRHSEDLITLVFSAEVYQDGLLENVKQHDQSEVEQEWSRVKAYDSAFVRHWDSWVNPRKRSQLFSVDLSRKKDGFVTAWHFDGEFRNLLSGTTLESPVKPFGGAEDFAVSGRFVAFTAKDPELPPAWHTKQNIYVVPLKGGEAPRQVSSGKHGWAGAPTFSPDGDNLVWLQMQRDGFESDRRVLQVYNLNSHSHNQIYGSWDSSPSKVEFSKDSSKLWLISEDREEVKLFAASIHRNEDDGSFVSSEAEPQPIISKGAVANAVELADGRILYAASSLTSPVELFLTNADGTQHPTRLTRIAQDSVQLSGIDFGPEAENFEYLGSEGIPRHGTIIRPPAYDATKENGYPVAVLIHGGPEGAWTNSWSTRWNPKVLAAQGFIVVTIDPAGSTGFGQEYTDSILHNWGGRPYYDIRAGVHYALSILKTADPERVVGLGASYGGYMVNWIQGHNDDKLFKALVCHDGVFMTTSSFFAGDELYFPEAEFGGVPWKAAAVYDKWSPHNHASNWKTPQLVIHGGKDFRLTESEGLAAFNTLQRRGIPSRFLYFPEENHWVLKPENSLRWHQEVISWIQKWSTPGVFQQYEIEFEQKHKQIEEQRPSQHLVFQN